jgi:hypothetical protein
MDENPKGSQPEPSTREGFNRIAGLSCYAGGVVMLGLTLYGIVDVLQSKGIAGLRNSLGELGLFAAATGILFAIGYTTGRSKR